MTCTAHHCAITGLLTRTCCPGPHVYNCSRTHHCKPQSASKFTPKPEIPIVSEGGTHIQFEDVWNCQISGCSLTGAHRWTVEVRRNLVSDPDCSSDTLATKEKLDLTEAEAPCWCGQYWSMVIPLYPEESPGHKLGRGEKHEFANTEATWVCVKIRHSSQSLGWSSCSPFK